MSDNNPGPASNPCRYGYLYGFQPLAFAPLAIGEVRKHKSRTGDTPSISTLGDYYLYTLPRAAFERALCGKNIQLPLTQATYTTALDSEANVVLASPLPLDSVSDIATAADALVDYLAHLHRIGGPDAVAAFLARNPHPAARAHIAELLGFDPASPDFVEVCQLIAEDSVDPILPNPAARAFFASEVAPVLAASFELEGAPLQVLDLNWSDEDVTLGERTGVLSLRIDRHAGRLTFTARHRPDSPGLPAVVINHQRGIVEVVPLLPLADRQSAEKIVAAWAEAIPVVGPAAKAVVTTAYHFRPSGNGPAPTITVGISESDLRAATSITIEPPSFENFSDALDAANDIAVAAGLSPDLAKELRRRLLLDSGTGMPRWMYRSHLVAEATSLVHHSELGHALPLPATASRGSAHPDLYAAHGSPAAYAPPADLDRVLDLTDSGPYASPDTAPVDTAPVNTAPLAAPYTTATAETMTDLADIAASLEQVEEVRVELNARVTPPTGLTESPANHAFSEEPSPESDLAPDPESELVPVRARRPSARRTAERRGFDFPAHIPS